MECREITIQIQAFSNTTEHLPFRNLELDQWRILLTILSSILQDLEDTQLKKNLRTQQAPHQEQLDPQNSTVLIPDQQRRKTSSTKG